MRGFVTSDHAAAVEALRNEDADISFMGALPYVLANEHVGAQIILQEVYRGAPSYTSRIYVRRDSGLTKLADLEGKTIAFADPISESGYPYPLDEFAKAGLLERGTDPGKFFDRLLFAGGYQQAIQAVASGLVDAAGASVAQADRRAFARLERQLRGSRPAAGPPPAAVAGMAAQGGFCVSGVCARAA